MNKGTGFLVLFIIAIVVELFIETSGMISKQFHPILSIIKGIKKRCLQLYHMIYKKKSQKEIQNDIQK